MKSEKKSVKYASDRSEDDASSCPIAVHMEPVSSSVFAVLILLI